MNPHDTTLLVDLVARKHDCLVRLGELGRRQRELIDAGDVGQLLTLLAAKQRLLEELQQWERRLDPYRADDPDRRTWTSSAERTRCASLAERSARLLAEILESERRCEEALRRRRDETAAELAAVNSAGMARGAYLQAQSYDVATLDLSTDA